MGRCACVCFNRDLLAELGRLLRSGGGRFRRGWCGRRRFRRGWSVRLSRIAATAAGVAFAAAVARRFAAAIIHAAAVMITGHAAHQAAEQATAATAPMAGFSNIVL